MLCPMDRGSRSPDATTARVDAGADTVDVGPVDHDPLRSASPSVDDFEGQRARAAIASRLFSGPAQPVRVGRYRILGRIGSGGMGVVYRAHDPELARDVAVKVVNPSGGGGTDQAHAQARLVREARAMAKLAHPNVIHVYDVGTVDEGVFIAMELVEGRSLAQWLSDTQPTWRDILEKFVAAGRGLAAAHAASVIHRDFKPHNVLVGDDGRVRVGDFGLAGGEAAGPTGPITPLPHDENEKPELDRASVSGTLTRTGMLLGTPKYMSPEQEAGAVASARSDQFSFCVALYEALYGRPPYAGDSVDVYRRNVRRGRVMPPPPDAKVRSWVHTEILRGLEVDPAARHPGMEVLLDRLEGALDDPSVTRRRRRQLRMAAMGTVAAAGIGLAFWSLDTPQARDAAAQAPDPEATSGHDTSPTPRADAPAQAIAVPVPVPSPMPVNPGRDAPPSEPDVAPDTVAGPDKPATTPRPATDDDKRTSTKKKSRPPRNVGNGGQDVCYYREHNSKFIKRTRKAQPYVQDGKGTCWDCSHRVWSEAAGGLNPNDCDAYYMCLKVDAAACTD